MKDKYLNLIESDSLKNKINETHFEFSDQDLLALTYFYAPNFEKRLELLEELTKESLDISTVVWAKKLLEFEKRKLNEFKTVSDDVIFEVLIMEFPNSSEERYFAKTYDGAINKIKFFYEKYGGNDNEKSRYKIVKRKVYDSISVEDFDEDELGHCELISGIVLYDVNMYNIINEFSDSDDNQDGIIDKYYIKFPKFLNDGDLVSYIDYDNKKVYGIVTYSEADGDSPCCMVLLENPYINNKTVYQKENGYYPVFMCHGHVQYPFITKENVNEVPTDVREKYDYFMEFWKTIGFEK